VLGYIGTRVLLVLPTLFGVTLVTFVLTYILPGNPALVKAGPLATPQHIAEMERRMGLDQPMAVQYWRYVRGLAHGDLGESHTTGRPVLEDLLQRVPATLELTLAALAVALVIGIPLVGWWRRSDATAGSII
jgi:peptide/nickel transport system permease protein